MILISIIVPVLNEEENLARTLHPLQSLRNNNDVEIIVVDGGSTDNSCAIAEPLADKLISSPQGRARQMNEGAKHTNGLSLLFLHADTLLPTTFSDTLQQIHDAQWGRFDVQLDDQRRMYRVIATMMNWRSRLSGIATGDQAIFIEKALFDRAGGFAAIPLMEDIEISRRLRRISPPLCLREQVLVSPRYWQKNGIISSVFRMWMLRSAYFLGVSPDRLIKIYYRTDL